MLKKWLLKKCCAWGTPDSCTSRVEQLQAEQPGHPWAACAQGIQHTAATSSWVHVHNTGVQQRCSASPHTLCMGCAVNVHTRVVWGFQTSGNSKWHSFSIWRSFIYNIHAGHHSVPLSLEWLAGMRRARGIIYIHYFVYILHIYGTFHYWCSGLLWNNVTDILTGATCPLLTIKQISVSKLHSQSAHKASRRA